MSAIVTASSQLSNHHKQPSTNNLEHHNFDKGFSRQESFKSGSFIGERNSNALGEKNSQASNTFNDTGARNNGEARGETFHVDFIKKPEGLHHHSDKKKKANALEKFFIKVYNFRWGLPQPKWEKKRQYVYKLFDESDFTVFSYYWTWFIMTVIFISVLLFILETDHFLATWSDDNGDVFLWFEAAIMIIFSFDYLIRFVTCQQPVKFFFYWLNLVDLLSIIPFYIEVALYTSENSSISGFTALRLIRVFRIFRLLKMSRHSVMMQMFFRAIWTAKSGIFFLIFLMAIFSIFFGTCVYYAETSYCEKDADGVWYYTKGDSIGDMTLFQSIPRSMWWCLVTLTTVGYGDMSPITPWGKMVASATMIAALIAIAFPVTILSTAFANEAEVFINGNGEETHATSAAITVEDSFKNPEAEFLEFKIQQVEQELAFLKSKRKEFQSNFESEGCEIVVCSPSDTSIKNTLDEKARLSVGDIGVSSDNLFKN